MSALDGYYRFGPLPEVDETTGSMALALGHFATVTRFVVRETFVGALPAQFDIAHRADEIAAPIVIGAQRPYLVVVHTDGQAHAIAGYARVYELAPRGYAVPVTDRRAPSLHEPLQARPVVFRDHDWQEGVAVGDAIALFTKLYFRERA